MAEIDLQAKMEGESNDDYLAYLTHRDAGAGRTITGSYNIFQNKKNPDRINTNKSSVPASQRFRNLAIRFDWDKRLIDWDNRAHQRVQDALIAADRKRYLEQLEKNRSQLERTAANGMSGAELAQTILRGQLQVLSRESTGKDSEGRPIPIALTKTRLDDLCKTTRALKDAIDGLSAAKHEYYDSVGLIDTIKELDVDD